MNLVPIPLSVAALKVPSTKLSELPVGAGYSIKSGQATVSVTKGENDSLIITGTCDSLARQVILLQEELTRIRSDTEIEEPPPAELTWWQRFWIKTGKLLAGAIGIYIIIQNVRKRFKPPSKTD